MLAVGAFFLLIGGLAVAKLASLQGLPAVQALPESDESRSFEPQRGSIFDAHGYLLAVSTTVYDLAALPANITDTLSTAGLLSEVLHRPSLDLLQLLQQGKTYIRIQRGVSQEQADTILSWKRSGLQAEPRSTRVYPNGALAVCALGFVTESGVASHGIEAKYDDELGGEPGYRVPDRDSMGGLVYRYYPPHDGVDLYLTLDRNIQHVVEQALERGVRSTMASKGIAVVMDPRTGAILAMAVLPDYDPNTRIVSDESIFVNSAVSEAYEPGSVFKVITVVSALDAGTINASSTYYDSGEILVGGRPIRNSDLKAHGETSIRDLLAKSLNVGSATVSGRMGAKKFYEYLSRFRFGQLTGIDLALETSGWVRMPGNPEWHESDLATNSYGQGLAVTPLQMISAIAAVANHGVMMRPYVVARQVDGSQVTEVSPQVLRQVVSSEAASEVTDILVYAAETVADIVGVSGYSVAGKSGTSEVYTSSGGVDPNETVASFAGYAPADDPRFAILVVLDRPQLEHYGTRAAGPVFQEIAEEMLSLMGVPPDNVRTGNR
jgi:cell division protein FtsI/penicillin-binding protein 2